MHLTPDRESEFKSVMTYVVLVLLVAVGAGSRLLEALPNFSAVGAVALFAGFYFRSRALAVSAVVVSMLLSDLVVGGYDWQMMLVVYGSIAAPAFFSQFLGQRPGVERVAVCAVASSAVFFAVTNFAVWSMGGMYEKSLSGLIECYTMAIPFAKYTLAGDVLFGVGLFAAYYAVERVRDARALAAV